MHTTLRLRSSSWPRLKKANGPACTTHGWRLGWDRPNLATSLLDLALVLMDEQHSSEAEQLLREAVAIRGSRHHAIDAEEALTYEQYAIALRMNGRSADAPMPPKRAPSQ